MRRQAFPLLRQAARSVSICARPYGKAVRLCSGPGAVSGAVRWDAGRADGETVSLVVYESTYFDRAAHPTTRAVGMTFDALGHRVTRADVLAMIPQRTAEEINGEIEKQAAERGIPLFPAKWRTVEDWPQEFYVGADNKIYFIFQQYEVAPYASGFVVVEAGEYKAQ